jgi:hypothetical protein
VDKDYAPGPDETAYFMAGRILVELIFVESTQIPGNCPPNEDHTETWDDSRKQLVREEVAAGLSFWPARADRPHPLTFVVEDRTLPTSCEPINRPVVTDYWGDRDLWIADVLTAMGCPADPFNFVEVERSCLHELRVEQGFDWAFFIFVVDSDNDEDGAFFYEPPQFPISGIADYHLHFVMTYDNTTWTIAGMDQVTAHETGHVFGAPDEYGSSGCRDSLHGYLQVANWSCNVDCGPPEAPAEHCSDSSIMAEIVPGTDVSISARGAIGWRNPVIEDGFTIVDVVRTSAVVLPAFAPDPSPSGQPAYEGSVSNIPFPPGSSEYRPVTVSKVKTANWRVNGGSVGTAIPIDGEFGDRAEAIRFFPAGSLANGVYTFEVLGINSFGHGTLLPAFDQLEIAHNKVLDTDQDGCTDARELGPYAALGGLRDPYAALDFPDVSPAPVGDKRINVFDTQQVAFRYNTLPGPGSLYDAKYDRRKVGLDPWDLGPGDGKINLDDLQAFYAAFGHDCS